MCVVFMGGRTTYVERDSREGVCPSVLSHCERNTEAERKLDVKCFRDPSLSGLHLSSIQKAVVCHPNTLALRGGGRPNTLAPGGGEANDAALFFFFPLSFENVRCCVEISIANGLFRGC